MPSVEGMNPTQREKVLRTWLRGWYLERTAARVDRFWNTQWGAAPALVEAYEISEYAGRPSDEQMDRLFPGRLGV